MWTCGHVDMWTTNFKTNDRALANPFHANDGRILAEASKKILHGSAQKITFFVPQHVVVVAILYFAVCDMGLRNGAAMFAVVLLIGYLGLRAGLGATHGNYQSGGHSLRSLRLVRDFDHTRKARHMCFHGWWDKRGEWSSARECPLKRYPPHVAAHCLKRHRRVLMIGDSVHRGIFWELVEYFKALESSSFGPGWNVTIFKRFVAPEGHFTNFEDQDLIVRRNGEDFFSVRFVYASNAIDFPARCGLIKDWFFQCLESLEDVLLRVHKEEMAERRSPKKHILYINTGLWDWRTGLSPPSYAKNIARMLVGTKSVYKSFSKVIWRTTSASWPSKFMTMDECKKKRKVDPRPCSTHTGEIREYNEKTVDMLEKNGFRIVPSWEVTATRPDLSYDGLHFKLRNRTDHSAAVVYRVLNTFFLNEVCSDVPD